MKKIILPGIGILILICVWILVTLVQKDDEANEYIEIELQIGSDTVHINGEKSKIEAPYISNDVTLVPLSVIAEAFGATVNWGTYNTKKVTLEYEKDKIEITIDQPIAFINDMAVALETAAELKNGTPMVPIHMISENFGATVNYEDQTKKITIKKMHKPYIGDSYYNWYMKYPDYLILDYQSDFGDKVSFSDDENNYSISIEVKEDVIHPSIEIDQELKNYWRSYTSPEMIEKQLFLEDEIPHAQVISQVEKSYYIERIYYDIQSGMLYALTLTVPDKQYYEDKKGLLTDLINSFTIGYQESTQIRDLTVIEDGYFTFRDERHGIVGKLPLDWNDRPFVEGKPKFHYNVTLVPEGHSLEAWLDQIDFDHELEYGVPFRQLSEFSIIEGENYFGAKGTMITVIRQIGSFEIEQKITDIYFIKGKYKYHFQIRFSLDTPDEERIKIIETIFNSLSIEEVHPGAHITQEYISFVESSGTEVYTSDDHGIQIELPIDWSIKEHPFNTVLWTISSIGTSGSIGVAENVSFESEVKYIQETYEDSILKQGTFILNDFSVYYCIYFVDHNRVGVKYYVNLNDRLLEISLNILDIVYSKRLHDLIENTVKSIQLIG